MKAFKTHPSIEQYQIKKIQLELNEHGSMLPYHLVKMRLWFFMINLSYWIKRLFDIFISVMAIVILSPLFITCAILIKLGSDGPVFYVQNRVGLYGRIFRFYKFRTMYMNADKLKEKLQKQNESADGVIFKMKKDPRITRIGSILRKTSMDELPQLLNVLYGNMSLVGPRPPLPSEVLSYTLEDRKRLNVSPGITGIWQISGRSDIPFKKQVALDKAYISSQSLLGDLFILLKTIPAILSGKGAY
ncbi:MAG: sugar transferase [Lentisphaeria bacterium]